MSQNIICEDTKRFLVISTLILVMGCILVFQLISTINITTLVEKENNISIVYNITE